MKIAVLNTKGGASKSTVALQVLGAYFLKKEEPVEVIELDDENKDAESFSKTAIKTRQVKVGDGSAMSEILRSNIKLDDSNLVIDVGGNKTTTLFIDALKKSFLYEALDLIVIPMSGGSQDLKNAEKTYEMVKPFNKKILFALSRMRNIERKEIQYGEFFKTFPKMPYIILKDSDVIDLSRQIEKTVFEVANDVKYGETLGEIMKDALLTKNDDKFKFISVKREIFEESKEYVADILEPAWEKIEKVLAKK
ncbi:MAG: hypothetical protein PHO65_07010 [Sulfurovum sp.]|nr:hypothetical protein [Sulfurovum sp.]